MARALKQGGNGFITSNLIKVLVGPDSNHNEFSIHKDIIASRSKLFANRLSGRWGNSETDTVELFKFDPDMRPEALARYLEVIYTSEIAIDATIPGNFINICTTYVIAEQVEDVKTRNLILKAVCEHTSNTTSTTHFRDYNALRIVYEGTASPENPLRRLLVEYWRRRGTAASWVQDMKKTEKLPKEFFVELAIALFNKGTINHEHSRQLPAVDMQDYLEKENEDAVDQQMSTSVDIQDVA